ncbi:glucosaminidase domain-containing protein [Candidatus Enterococcus ferrettii]|uniref:Mannosyl-glycoprotein endo-beta-N-acetylglucosamidase-like domain-containing protein n=1 Tax=Candidatus Enterococcus ferrettii TaxID=2815324 RepID=A0ABV0EMN3_9ENTE|nr:glucosaminidase domain-containing protein [Enterococcus sp. 665A]MBO1339040.1 glucosaminidase domain-containing protein [Enterococcus sp. 665A]
MLSKFLLGCLVLGGGLITSYQLQAKSSVLAETKESIFSQQEMTSSIAASSTGSSMASEESTIPSESSFLEEITSNETGHSTSSVTEFVKPIKATDESTEGSAEKVIVSEATVPEVVSQVQTPVPAAKVEENYQFSVVKNQTTEAFIQTIGADAQTIAWSEGLYASVMIAQAILETGSGNSQLARPPYHNLFGIKGSYQGKNVSFNTQEDKGNGQLYTIQSAFRQYPGYRESLEDYAALLKKGISSNAGFYQATWKENASTYQAATKALTGKYATDTSYDKKLNALIETYGLDAWDQEPKKETIEPSVEGQAATVDSTTDFGEDKQSITFNSEALEKQVKINKTKQSVQKIPEAAQRPAKQLAGNRTTQ